ncbi:MAG TPA: exosortase B [Usitatibacter sp.]|nr:exosortase B [Usitatibacter sp.]
MSTVLERRGLRAAGQENWKPWLAVLAGLAILYVPTCVSLARTLWRDDEYAHGPIILAIFAWLVWRDRAALVEGQSKPGAAGGFLLLAVGLFFYIVGRSQSLPLFEVGSSIPVIAGVVLSLRGARTLRSVGFAIAFLFFLVPLPGFLLEAATGPLKQLVSAAVAALLQALGYPIERMGVVLTIGDHQMLVADACSGMNSLYSLFALTLLYLHLTGPSSRARIAVLLASVVPIAIVANVLRVLALVLVTYRFGDDAGQGVFHTAAGMLVFTVAFLLLTGVDRIARGREGIRRQSVAPLRGAHPAPISRTAAIAVVALMVGAAFAAPQMKPVPAESAAPDLERLVPSAFGDWSIDPSVEPIAPAPDVQAKLDRIYGSTLSRTYVNSSGEQMMLTLAYGGDQSDALKAHRQEVCYAAQGFTIHGLREAELATPGREIPVTRMLAVRGERSEPVTYWFTMGDRVVQGRAERLGLQLAWGLRGRIPDGMLVRVSSLSADPDSAFAAQRSFIASLLAAVAPADATRIAGAPRP